MRAPWLASPFGMRILTKTIRWALSLFFASTIFAVVAIRYTGMKRMALSLIHI